MLVLILCNLGKLSVFYSIYVLFYCIKITFWFFSISIVLYNILMNLHKFSSFGLELIVKSWLYFKVFGLV